MSLVMEATAQSPERRGESSASAVRKGAGGAARFRASTSAQARKSSRPGDQKTLFRSVASTAAGPRPRDAPTVARPCTSVNALRGMSHRPAVAPIGPTHGLLRGRLGLDRDVGPPVALGGELHAAFGQRKQRVVRAHADIGPGCHLVPRWRARMLPASTCSPPYFLTPSRRPAVSRPLREEPPAFLCAIVSILAPTLGSGADDFLDAHRRLFLAVAALAARVLAPALLEGDDLAARGPARRSRR